jgi:hypothetical protein
MSTTHTAIKPTPIRRTSAIVTAAGVLLAIGIAVLFLALVGGNSASHAVAAKPAGPYYPLIQYHGTGAPPVTATPSTPPASSRGSNFYGEQP